MRNFHSIISAVLSVSGLTHIKNMAAEARWEEVFSSIDGLLIETESQENKSSPRVSRSRTTPKHT